MILRKTKTRLLSMLLAFVMVAAMLPVTAFATGSGLEPGNLVLRWDPNKPEAAWNDAALEYYFGEDAPTLAENDESLSLDSEWGTLSLLYTPSDDGSGNYDAFWGFRVVVFTNGELTQEMPFQKEDTNVPYQFTLPMNDDVLFGTGGFDPTKHAIDIEAFRFEPSPGGPGDRILDVVDENYTVADAEEEYEDVCIRNGRTLDIPAGKRLIVRRNLTREDTGALTGEGILQIDDSLTLDGITLYSSYTSASENTVWTRDSDDQTQWVEFECNSDGKWVLADGGNGGEDDGHKVFLTIDADDAGAGSTLTWGSWDFMADQAYPDESKTLIVANSSTMYFKPVLGTDKLFDLKNSSVYLTSDQNQTLEIKVKDETTYYVEFPEGDAQEWTFYCAFSDAAPAVGDVKLRIAQEGIRDITGDNDNIKVEYSLDNGSSWVSINAAGAAPDMFNNDGEYIQTLTPAGNYRVQLRVTWDEQNYFVSFRDNLAPNNMTVKNGVACEINTGDATIDVGFVRYVVSWAYDASIFGSDAVVTNGTVDVIAMRDAAGSPIDITGRGGLSDTGGEYIMGGTNFTPAKYITVELKPDYGYQVKTIAINNMNLVAGEDISTFTFEHEGTNNLHFSAIFEAVPDKVDVSGAENVTGAAIGNGGNATASGNLSLTVEDDASGNFQFTDSDANLLDGYLFEMTLDQIVSKGNGENWVTNITEFENPITVTLYVGTGLDTNQTYYVIREHEGVYTKLPATYDAVSGTLAFETNQFSTFAIATAAQTAGSHTHTWAAAWTSDGSSHWHECTAAGCPVTANSQKDGYTAHTPEADDGDCTTAIKCSVCDTVTTAAKSEHTYGDDADTTCNFCEHVRILPHVHKWETAWTNNATHHWHECADSDCNVSANREKSGYGAHSNNGNGVCSICGYLMDMNDVDTKTEQTPLTEVPEGLKDTAFNSVAKIESELVRVLIGNDGYTAGNTVAFDVVLKFSTDGGATWQTATEENFPAEGITVVIPYPEGTSRDTHDFVVTHMFTVTSDKLGTVAGQTEQPAVIELENGIQVTLKGLSPVGIAWKTVSDTPGETPDDTTDDIPGGTDDDQLANVPQTGDNSNMTLWIALMVSATCGLVAVYFLSAHKKRGRFNK